MNSLDKNKKRYIFVIASALLQGLLLGLYAITRSGMLAYMPLSIILLVPFVFWLSQEHWGHRLLNFIIILTLVLFIFWLYRLWSLYSPGVSLYVVPSQKSDLIRLSLAVFLLIPFFQCRIASWSWRFPYSEIFFQFCRNLFLLFSASIVIAVFWGLLVTAGLLFDIVGLESVPLVIFNPLIALPLSCLTIAISISVAIKHPGIDSLGRWLLSVLAWLLPFFSILSLVFILCLPFSGLKTLWNTGQASTLMLLLEFGTIILANAAWLDGSKPAFKNSAVDLLAKISLMCLPVYTGLCVYSVGLRVQQYGLSTDRIQAVFLVAVTGIWGVGYAVAVLLNSWPSSIGKVNMACVVFMALIVASMNCPILDPYRLSAYNQVKRLQSGAITPEEFDYLYTRFNLGRYGNNVLRSLSDNASEEVKQGIEDAMKVKPEEYAEYINRGLPPVSVRRKIISQARVYPVDKKISDEQINYFLNEWIESSLLRNVQSSNDLIIAFVNLSTRLGGSEAESENIILFTQNAAVVYETKPEIKPVGVISMSSPLNLNSFFSSDIKIIEPKFMDFELDGHVYQVLR